MLLVRLRIVYAAAVVASFTCNDAALAQVAAPGSHVRIVPVDGGPRQEGTLVTMTNDTLSFHAGLSNMLLAMPMDSVRTLFASDGAHSHPVRSGMIGAGIGVGGLVLALVAATKVGGGGDGPGAGVALFYLTAPAALLGFATGYIIGESHPSESWERVYDRSQSASLLIGPAPHEGFALGVSIPFDAGTEH